MRISKPVKIIGGFVFLCILAAGYMFFMHLTPRDFVRTPEGVLDDAIYAAQQRDLKAFKRTFTNDIQIKMQAMHDNNTNREDATLNKRDNPDLFWTWDTLMDRMAKQGGFEVKKTSTKFFDYMIDGKAKLDIVYYDKERDKQRQKNYTILRNDLVWRIDLDTDPEFKDAYHQSVRNYRSNADYDRDDE